MSTTPGEASSSQQVYEQLHQAVSAYRSGTPVPPVVGPSFDVNFFVSHVSTTNLLAGSAQISLASGSPDASVQAMYLAISNAVPPTPAQPYCEGIMGPAAAPSPALALPKQLLVFSNQLPSFDTSVTVYAVAILIFTFNGQQQTGMVSMPVQVTSTSSAISHLMTMNSPT